MSFEIITYTRQCLLNGRNNATQTTGVQIGRFAIRHDPNVENNPALPPGRVAPWRVDHIPTGLTLVALRSSEAAYAYADDVSRFSLEDVSAKDPYKAVVQIGASLQAWTKFVQKNDGPGSTLIPYRAWLLAEGKLWTPTGLVSFGLRQEAAETEPRSCTARVRRT